MHYNRSLVSPQSESCSNKQELFAEQVICLISRTRMAVVSKDEIPHMPQFKKNHHLFANRCGII